MIDGATLHAKCEARVSGLAGQRLSYCERVIACCVRVAQIVVVLKSSMRAIFGRRVADHVEAKALAQRAADDAAQGMCH